MSEVLDTRDRADDGSGKGTQIGVVAERTGLSLRTIRYYEEEGLVTPSARTAGGFRLYTEADSARLELIKQMKPLGFSLDEMRDLLRVLDRLAAPAVEEAEGGLIERLDEFTRIAEERCELLQEQLRAAARFADRLRQWSMQARLRGNKR